MHVDVEIAGLERLHLRLVQFGRRRRRVRITVLDQGNDHRSVGAAGTLVNVGHGALDAGRSDAAFDGPVWRDREAAAAGAGRRGRRNFLGTAQAEALWPTLRGGPK